MIHFLQKNGYSRVCIGMTVVVLGTPGYPFVLSMNPPRLPGRVRVLLLDSVVLPAVLWPFQEGLVFAAGGLLEARRERGRAVCTEKIWLLNILLGASDTATQPHHNCLTLLLFYS